MVKLNEWWKNLKTGQKIGISIVAGIIIIFFVIAFIPKSLSAEEYENQISEMDEKFRTIKR